MIIEMNGIRIDLTDKKTLDVMELEQAQEIFSTVMDTMPTVVGKLTELTGKGSGGRKGALNIKIRQVAVLEAMLKKFGCEVKFGLGKQILISSSTGELYNSFPGGKNATDSNIDGDTIPMNF